MSASTIDCPSPQIRPEDIAHLLPEHAPSYAVILHNDPINTFEFVIAVLQKVFGYPKIRAFALTLKTHHDGRCALWSGALEIAEWHADRIRSCGADPSRRAAGAQPLGVTIEPLPR